jgi:hypothetical protein
VLEDSAGLAELRRLGARSVPVLSRGDDYTFAQNIAQVVQFLGLNEATGPALTPAELAARVDVFLTAAERFIPLMPDALLTIEVPNRPRTYRVLGHHMFCIADAFLEVAGGTTLAYERLTTADIVAYGQGVHQRFNAWWSAKADKSGKETVQTYYGPQLLHEYLERTTWHIGQHVRQWTMLLGMNGVTPEQPLGDEAFAKLPMPSSVWDG